MILDQIHFLFQISNLHWIYHVVISEYVKMAHTYAKKKVDTLNNWNVSYSDQTSKSTRKKLRKFHEAAVALNKQAAEVKAAMTVEKVKSRNVAPFDESKTIGAMLDSNTDTDDEEDASVCHQMASKKTSSGN